MGDDGIDGSHPDDYDWNIDYIEEWLEFYRAAKPRSQPTRKSELRQFDEWAREEEISHIDELSYRNIKRYAVKQKQEFAHKTAEGRLTALKKCLDEAFRDDVIDEHPLLVSSKFSDLLDDWGINPQKSLREEYLDDHDLEEGVSEEEYEQLRKHVRAPKNRNQAVIDLLYWTGMRAGEVGRIKVSNVNYDKRLITHPDLKKSDPDAMRTSKYSEKCDLSLASWLGERDRYQCLKDADEDWLFCSKKKAPLSGDAISDFVREAAKEAGIQQKIGEDAIGRPMYYINTHALRHGHGTWAVDKVGIHRVQEQLGHSSVELTESTYVHSDPEDEENPYNELYD